MIYDRDEWDNNISIKCVPEVTDLGVTISSDLSFKSHINSIVAKTRRRQGIFFRGFCSRDPELVRKAFITYIRPILEYNSIWNPTQIFLIDLIENVQRNFTKNIPYLSDLSYNDRLAKLKLEPLELRRLHFDLIFYYKIINQLLPIDPSKNFTIYLSPPLLDQIPLPSIDPWRLPNELWRPSSIDRPPFEMVSLLTWDHFRLSPLLNTPLSRLISKNV